MKFRLKNNRNYWYKSVVVKLMTSLIAILLPLFILFFMVFNISKDITTKEISKSTLAQISMFLGQLENDIESIYKIQMSFSSNENFMSLSIINEQEDGYEKVKLINNINDMINTMYQTSIYIKEISVLLPSINATISTKRLYDKLNTKDYLFFKDNCITNGQIIYHNRRLFMVTKVPQFPNIEPDFILVTELDIKKISEALDQLDIFNNSHVYLMNLSEGFILSNSHEKKELSDGFLGSIRAIKIIPKGINYISWDGMKYIVVMSKTKRFDMTLLNLISFDDVFSPLKIIQNYFILFCIISVLVIIAISVIVVAIVKKPLHKLSKGFKQIETGNLEVTIKYKGEDEFSFIYKRFQAMLDTIKNLIEQVYKQKILTQKAELKHLQSQINPHFLYNSFFMLSLMARNGDIDTLEEFTLRLGEYFKFVTRNTQEDIALEKEYEHAKNYSEIQATRFSNRIKIVFSELPDKIRNIPVPRLIIQPIIENAFVHSLESKMSEGLLEVYATADEDEIKINIIDNGDCTDSETIKNLTDMCQDTSEDLEVTGLVNIHRRLKMKYGAESGLSFNISSSGGLYATITIKNFKRANEEEQV